MTKLNADDVIKSLFPDGRIIFAASRKEYIIRLGDGEPTVISSGVVSQLLRDEIIERAGNMAGAYKLSSYGRDLARGRKVLL